MSFLLPSDMGRLIYGYLRTFCSEQLAEEFLNTSDSMKECRKYRHIGFDARVHDRTLTQMLNEYSVLSDLICEHCPENERSNFNIVKKLQTLLESRSECSKKPAPTDATTSTSRESESVPGDTATKQFLSNAFNTFREEDPSPRLESPSQCSKLLPLNCTSAVNCNGVTTSHRITPTVSPALARNSPSATTTHVPTNLAVESNSNTTILSESSSPFKSTPIFGIAKSTPVLTKVVTTTTRTTSPAKLKKSGAEQCNTVISDANSIPRIPSPLSVSSPVTRSTSLFSPSHSPPLDVIEIDDEDSSSESPVFNVPTTPLKNNTSRKQTLSDKLVTPTKRCLEDRSPKQRIETNSVTHTNPKDSLSKRTPVRSSPKQPGKTAKKDSVETSTKNLVVENPSSVLQSSKPATKILPKLPSQNATYTKSYASKKDTDEERKSLFARPTIKPSEPVPWDYALRQSLSDGAEIECADASKKEGRKRKSKKDGEVPVSSSKSESNAESADTSNKVPKKECKKHKSKKDGDVPVSTSKSESSDSRNDVSKKEFKKHKSNKDGDVSVSSSTSESSKRKHDTKPTVSKKLKTVEEAKKENATGDSLVDPSKRVQKKNDGSSEIISGKPVTRNEAKKENATKKHADPSKEVHKKNEGSSEIIPDETVDIAEPVVAKTPEVRDREGVCKIDLAVSISSTPLIVTDRDSEINEENVSCLKLSEEIVLYNKESQDSSFPTDI